MMETLIDRESQQVLWACLDYWKALEPNSPENRVICFNWIKDPYQKKFESSFDKSVLKQLSKQGFLKEDGSSRKGKRRYYKIVDPIGLEKLLGEWGLGLDD